jgi:hypothetical protein
MPAGLQSFGSKRYLNPLSDPRTSTSLLDCGSAVVAIATTGDEGPTELAAATSAGSRVTQKGLTQATHAATLDSRCMLTTGEARGVLVSCDITVIRMVGADDGGSG